MSGGAGAVAIGSLTSEGKPLVFTLSADGDVLTAHAGSGTGAVVFTVSLSDAGSGSYDFDLNGVLDHPVKASGASNEDVLSFTFTFTARDGDGDIATNNFTVKVIDDVPVVGPNTSSTVAEDGVKSVTQGLTGLGWGADNGSDRTLAVSTAVLVKDQSGQAIALQSNREAVSFVLIGAVLVAYVGTQPTVADAANVVFTVSTNAATGEYSFNLLQPLDHTSPTGTNQYLDLQFAVMATDSDGDAASGSFSVRVDAAGEIGSINYGSLNTGVIVNLSDAAVNYGGKSVAADTATDRPGANVVGVDGMAGVNDAYGSKAADILVGGAEDNVLKGNDGDDVLIGNDGDDTLVAGKGADRLEGGAGNDTLVVSADIDEAGAYGPRQVTLGDGTTRAVSLAGLSGEGDALIGGSDIDTVKFEAAAGASGFVFDRANSSLGLSGVERFEGTDGNDVILLPTSYTTSDSVLIEIDGGKGNDTLQGSNIQGDKITGGEGNDLISGLGGDDELFGGKGADEIWGGAGRDTIEGGDDADKLYGNDGEDILRGGAGDDIIDGGAGADRISGDGGADTLIGGGDNDQFFIGGGSDTVYGNQTDLSITGNRLATDGESDEVVVYGNQNDYAVTRNIDGSWQITSAGESDTLYGIEHINFNGGAVELDLTANVLVFNAVNQLVGTFSTIQAGVTFADVGFTVEVQAGVYNEAVVIGEGITLKGVGNVVVDGGEAGPAITVNGGGAGQSLLIDGIDLKSSSSSVILVDKAANFDTVTLKNGDVTGGDYHGLFVDNATNVEGVVVEKVNFSGNATTESVGAGEGPVTIFLYNGNVTFKDVAVSNPGTAAENGIQLRGVNPPFQPMGNVVFDNVDVSGTYSKVGVAIYNYTNANGLQIVNGGLDVNVTADWFGLKFESVGGTIDLSGLPLTVVNAFGAASNDIGMEGTSGNETFTGDDSDDFLFGKGGGDLLKGGAGDDAFLLAGDVTASLTRNIELGDGTLRAVDVAGLAGTADVVQGGTGADVIVLDKGATPGYLHDTYSAPSYMSGIERIVGTSGTDVILVDDTYLSDAAGGRITIAGGAGNDALGGGAGSDAIYGGQNDDLISGLGGDDALYGDEGNDEIWGGAGKDSTDGGAGNDTIYGNAGDDRIFGGDGDDRIIYTVGDGSDSIQGGLESGTTYPNYDELVIKGDASARTFTLGLATTESLGVAASKDIEVAYTGPNASSVYADEIERVTFNLGTGGDTVVLEDITGSAVKDTTVVINGGAGSDTIDLTKFAGSSVQIVDNGGSDTVKLGGLWTDYVFTEANGTYTIAKKNGPIIGTMKAIELVEFTGAVGKPGYTMPIANLVNIAPVAVDETKSVTEAGGTDNATGGEPKASGNLLGNDTDGNVSNDTPPKMVDILTVSQVSGQPVATDTIIQGIYGKLKISADGTYEYELDNNSQKTQQLRNGEIGEESFTYVVRDAGGLEDQGVLKITITGTNDAPVISVVGGDSALAELTETNARLTATGTLTVTDADAADVVKAEVTFLEVDGPDTGNNFQPGELRSYFSVTPNTVINAGQAIGTLTWAFDSQNQAFNFLAANTTLRLQYTVTVTDSSGAQDTQIVRINIAGTNDGPVLEPVTAINYTDTSADNTFADATGTLVASDIDRGDSKEFGIDGVDTNSAIVTKVGNYGTLFVTVASGAYTYVPNDAAIEGLKASARDEFTVTVTDRAGAKSQQTLTINLAGANDTADITGTFTGAVTEDGTQQTASGRLTVTDRDTVDVGFQTPASVAGTYGNFTFNSTTGEWAYALRNGDANVQALKEGEVVHDSITVLSKDGSDNQVIDVTINGTNDAPTISGLNNVTIPENQIGALIDTFQVGDVDTANGLTFRVLKADGVTVDNRFTVVAVTPSDQGKPGAYQLRLASGQSFDYEQERSVSLKVEVNDGKTNNNIATQSVTITVGDVEENRAPIANNDTLSFAAPAGTPPSGEGWTLNTANGHYYKFVAASGVSWSDAVTGAANQASGAYLLTLTSAEEQNFVLTNVGVRGQMLWLGASDAETEGTFKWVTGPEAGSVLSGYLPWNPGEPNNWGGNEDYVAINRNAGSNYSTPLWNDANSIENDTRGYVAEWGGSSGNGGVSENVVTTFSTGLLLANDTDADHDPLVVTGLGASNMLTATTTNGATVTLNTATGQISYDPTGSSTIQGLAQGVTLVDTFRYSISDGKGGTASATASITVNGVNDVPTITGLTSSTVSEDGTLIASGKLTITDADSGQSGATVASGNATYGTWSINASGTWTYTLDNTKSAVQGLNTGQSLNDSFTVTTADGTPQVINIVINGLNEVSLPATVTTYDIGTSAGKTTESAYNLNSLTYKKSNDPDVGASATSPSATIKATGSDGETDYYKLVVTVGGTKVVFDIDNTNFDSVIRLTKQGDNAYSNVSDDNGGDAGSTNFYGVTDSSISATLSAGTYFLQVGKYRAQSDYQLGNLGSGTSYELQVSVTAPGTDPIILDLDKNGFAFSPMEQGLMFDINADGHKDQIAWTSDDGILAYDVDGNGVIDNGSEIFTPDFNGGKFASGVAALASLDTNGDGKIDAGDDAFSKLQVWIDANNNGISDAGELSSLSDHRVTSISLTADQSGGEEDGQTIFAEGEFTFADGTTGNFVEVGFDTIFGSDLSEGLTLHGGMGEVVMTGTDGADTFVFDGTALADIDVADIITNFSAEEGDALDVTALLDSLLGEQATVDTAASHIRATVDDGNTTVSVQTDNNTWKDVVVLQDHTTAIKVLFDDKHTTITPHD